MPNDADTSPPSGAKGRAEVVQDSSFSRIFVDNMLPIVMGRDVELAMLVRSPRLLNTGMAEQPELTELDMTIETLEICRARMSATTAANVSFNILMALIQAGNLDATQLTSTIQRMLALSNAAAPAAAGEARPQ